MGKPQRPPGPRRPGGPPKEILFGHRASLAIIATRPSDVLRIAVAAPLRREVEEAAQRAGIASVEFDVHDEWELGNIAGSPHHEGVCVLTKPRHFAPIGTVADALVEKKGVAIAFDRVRNPYNIGAILRTAAFFGVNAAILGAPAPHPALPEDAVRVAEGGAEHLLLSRTTDLADTLARLRQRGVRVFGAESEATDSIFGFAFPRPVVLVVGHEREGVGDRVRAQCNGMLAIPGAGSVHSLNVSIAASILLAEVLRR